MRKDFSSRLCRDRIAVSTVAIVAVVVVVILLVAVGAYFATRPTMVSAPSTSSASTAPTLSTTAATSTPTSTSAMSTSSPSSSAVVGPVTLNGAGSTLVFPVMSTWTYDYTSVVPNVRVNYASVGSGAGIAQITAKTVDFGASDAPLNSSLYAKDSGILQIPEIAGAVVPAYNIPGIASGALKFNGTVLAEIYLGNITMWNDPALVQLNPGLSLPAHSIFVVHRSDGSGTTFVFTDYLSHASSKWNSTVGKGTSVSWPVGFGAKGSEGVSGVIQGNQYSIGYMESAYATINKLSFGAIKNAAGNYVQANLTTGAAAVAAAASVKLPAGNQSWTGVSIVDTIFNNATATNAYPITTFTYLMVYQHQTDPVKGAALANFLWWVVNSAQSSGAKLGYIPLPASVVALDDATIASMTYNGQTLITTSTTST